MAMRSFSSDAATMSRRLLLTGAVGGASALVLAACGGTAEGGPVPTVTRVPAEGAPPTQSPAEATPEGAAATPEDAVATPAGEATPATGDETVAIPADEATPAAEASPETGGATAEPLIAFDIGWRLGDLSTPADAITLTVTPGATVELVSDAVSLHDFVVDALAIAVDIEPGVTTSATIPEDAAPGEYEFYCSVPGHLQVGMLGTLIVE